MASVVDREPRLSFFGISLPWLAVVLLYQTPSCSSLYLASRGRWSRSGCIRSRSPRRSRAMATLGVLILGGIWDIDVDFADAAVAVLYVLVIVGHPADHDGHAHRRPSTTRASGGPTSRAGPRLSWWDDLSLNRLFLVVVCADRPDLGDPGLEPAVAARIPSSSCRSGTGFPLAIANGVLVVAYFGLALQYFLLRFGRRGTNFLALFLFLTWVVPLAGGHHHPVRRTSEPGPVPRSSSRSARSPDSA